ncbi:GNAT family N-acetyltransferase [Thalassotalea ganghwensis]
MIRRLVHSQLSCAMQIDEIFQRSYVIEAELIGVSDFPPLSRRAASIVQSPFEFYGYFEQNQLAAVIEVEHSGQRLEIHSLTVDPKHFRKGIAQKLICYVFSLIEQGTALVETATANIPAIELYQKHGFKEFKRWVPEHGIEKLAMSVEI